MLANTDDDEALARAVASSHSWRGVLRHLGLRATSGGAIRAVRARADRLGIDTSHFTGGRRWSDEELRTAVSESRSWDQVAARLGLSGGSSTGTVKGHARRLGVELAPVRGPTTPADELPRMRLDHGQLPRAGSLIAAAWFTLCRYEVSWPLEPCRYDLVVHQGSHALRVQVKTTRRRVHGVWVVSLMTGGRRPHTYDPDEIDCFFVIDGDLAFYAIPVGVVAGLSTLNLSAYECYRVWRPLVPQRT